MRAKTVAEFVLAAAGLLGAYVGATNVVPALYSLNEVVRPTPVPALPLVTAESAKDKANECCAEGLKTVVGFGVFALSLAYAVRRGQLTNG